MKAAVIEAFNAPLVIQDVPSPECPKDGVIVELRACGVCRSDWHSWTGKDPDVKAPHVPGHEFAGIVIERGPDCTQFNIGDRVTAPFILSCGSCDVCKTGEPTTCDTQHVMSFSAWGAFAEYVAVPFADFNLVHLPTHIGFVEVAYLTDGGAHVSLEALGITETFHNSLKSLRKLGRHVQIGMPTGQHTSPTIPLLDMIYSRQLSLMGTRGMAANRFPDLFDLIERRDIDLSKLVTKQIPLEEAGAALEAFNHYVGAGITVIDRF